MADPATTVRTGIRVSPGARRPGVGGTHGESLVVRVTARAVEGQATDAALRAVADALGLRPRAVTLVSGATSREKVIDIDGDPAEIRRRLDELRTSRP